MLAHARNDILEAIGRTPLVKLQRVTAGVPADIYVKCEYLNPSGSASDRMALHLVRQAEARRELPPGGTIVEATTGNTGASLAMVAAVRGYRCISVVPDTLSAEKVDALRAWGARVVVCPSSVEPHDPRSFHSVAERLARETPQAYHATQYDNPDNPAGHYASIGPEIWRDTAGELDVFVAGLGTGGTLAGVGRYLRERNAAIKLVGVDPEGSLSYDLVKHARLSAPSSRRVEGLGADVLPSNFDPKLLDDVVRVDDRESFLMARQLVRREGLYVGGSSGAAVAGALKYARVSGQRQNIVVVLPDSASKSLSRVFNEDWLREQGIVEGAASLGFVRDLIQPNGPGVISAGPNETAQSVIATMLEFGISQLPVVEGGSLLGVVTEVALLRCLATGAYSASSTVGSLVESDYARVSPQTRLEVVQSVLAKSRAAIVCEGDRLIAVLTKIDLIEHLVQKRVLAEGRACNDPGEPVPVARTPLLDRCSPERAAQAMPSLAGPHVRAGS